MARKQADPEAKTSLGFKLIESFHNIISRRFNEYHEGLQASIATKEAAVILDLKKEFGMTEIENEVSSLNKEVAEINDKIVALQATRDSRLAEFMARPLTTSYFETRRGGSYTHLVEVRTTDSFDELVRQRMKVESEHISEEAVDRARQKVLDSVSLAISQKQAVDIINNLDIDKLIHGRKQAKHVSNATAAIA